MNLAYTFLSSDPAHKRLRARNVNWRADTQSARWALVDPELKFANLNSRP